MTSVVLLFYSLFGIALVLTVSLYYVENFIKDGSRNDISGMCLSDQMNSTDGANKSAVDVVPNIVHYVLFRRNYISFIHYVSIRSAQINHNPDKIFIHCSCDTLVGEYWERLENKNIFLIKTTEPKTIFGKPLGNVFHASDIGRIQALMKYGGIYLDTDVFVVNPLHKFFKYEMTLGWPEGQNLGTQVLIANKNARFLKLWLESYKHYNSSLWYYNAGVYPTQTILIPNPSLVHREKEALGVFCCDLCKYVFEDNIEKKEWRCKYHTIHLLYRWRWEFIKDSPPELYEKDVWSMKTTFGQMARSVLP